MKTKLEGIFAKVIPHRKHFRMMKLQDSIPGKNGRMTIQDM